MTTGLARSKTDNDTPISLELQPILTCRILKKTVEFQDVDRSDEDISLKAICPRENSITAIGDDNQISTQSGRLLQPRMSLLGRPLNYRASRRDARYRRLQSKIYNFLERPRGAAVLYHLFVFIMVFAGLALSVFSTIDEYEKPAGDILVYMESIVCVLFSVELILRTWSSGCRSRYQGYLGRLKFLRRPFCIIDMCTIIASIVVLAMTIKSGGQVLAASALRGLRFFQILRMVRMDRRGGTWKLLGSVVYAHRQELITTMYIGFLGLIFASFLVFLAEKEVPNTKFNNFAQALWWGVITLCTVGYGDMVPVTWQGKIIASFCSLLGISFFALPAGILGSGFALKVQQQQRAKHMIRRRQPAARLIQSAWRLYASDEKSTSVATWKIHQVAYSPPTRVAASSFRHNASFVGRFSTIRRHRNPLNPPTPAVHSPSLNVNKSTESVNNQESFRSVRKRASRTGSSNSNLSRNTLNASNVEEANQVVNETRVTVESANEEDESTTEEPQQVLQLTKRHKDAIRAIRWIKFYVARRKFREALKPYDVKDVIEQYSSGHADLMNRVKNLQFRLDQILGKQDSKSLDVYSSDISLASRVVKVERQVDDVFSKIEQFFEIYMEDRKHFVNPMSHQHASPGYDTSTSDFTYYNPGNISSTTSTSVCQTAVMNRATGSTYGLKPKSILVDKTASEPNSPIAKNFVSPPPQVVPTMVRKPIMQRGYSDVGSRIKKKVTLSASCSNYYDDPLPPPSSTVSPVNGSIILPVPPHPPTSTTISPPGTASVSSYTEVSSSAPSVSGTLVSMSSSIEASASAQNLSINMEMGYRRSRTITESTDIEDICCKIDPAVEEETEEKLDLTEDIEEEEDDTTETTLLCPPTSNEIIISPSTLNCTTKLEVVSENVYLKNLSRFPGKDK